MKVSIKAKEEEIAVKEHPPEGGKVTLYSIEREDGKMLVDNLGTLDMVYYGHSEDDAFAFYNEQHKNNNLVWY